MVRITQLSIPDFNSILGNEPALPKLLILQERLALQFISLPAPMDEPPELINFAALIRK